MSKKFTLPQLSKYNGVKNQPAYVAYRGIVYDASGVFKNGEHAGIKAGTDLTPIFSKSPHKEDIFSKLPQVGTLASEGWVWKLFATSDQQADLLLRLALGLIFFAHGSQKLFGWFGGNGWTKTIAFFTTSLHIAAPLAALAIIAEFFGGLAIIVGLLTRPAALGLAITSLVAALKVSLPNGFFLNSKGNGVEYLFALFLLSIYLVIKGAGRLSLDKIISEKIK